jgi:hypothetical protein
VLGAQRPLYQKNTEIRMARRTMVPRLRATPQMTRA